MTLPAFRQTVRFHTLETPSLSGPQSAPMRVPKSQAGWNPDRFAMLARRRWPLGTAFYLAREAGIPEATCKKHLDGTTPGGDATMRYLASPLGPDLLRAFCGGCDEPIPTAR